MNIGSRLKQILEEQEKSVNQLAREAGVSAQTLYAMIKRDSNKADMDILAGILYALNMDFMEFMGPEWQAKMAERRMVPAPKQRRVKKEEPKEERRSNRRELEDYLL